MQKPKKNNLQLKYHKRELYIRYLLILIIGITMPSIYGDYEVFSHDYTLAIVVSILRTAALWLGSKRIVELILSKYDFFKNTAKTLVFQVLSLVVYTSVIVSIEINILENYTVFEYSRIHKLYIYESTILITLFITTIYASTFFFVKWKENLLKAEKFEKATLEAKFEALKNQINPHFLFNSLNTLMGMMDEDSESTRYVQSLSDFLRYVLQTKDKELVSLGDEIEFSKQYAFIQQKRFNLKLIINFNVIENYCSYLLPPLSLQMLIENAIKHNVISKEKPLTINIYIADKKLIVENNLQRKNVNDSTGVGLENISNRYKYIGSEDINISESDNKFIVSLPLLENTK